MEEESADFLLTAISDPLMQQASLDDGGGNINLESDEKRPLARRRKTDGVAGPGAAKKREGEKTGSDPPPRKRKALCRSDKEGQFSADQVNLGKSLSADRRSQAKTVVPKGQGDRG